MGETVGLVKSLKDVMENDLQGVLGLKTLRKHLAETPIFAGGPTHRRWGRKIVFRDDDVKRLIDSLECRSKSSAAQAANISTSVEPSAERAFLKAQELLTKNRRKPIAPRGKTNSGRRVSLAPAR